MTGRLIKDGSCAICRHRDRPRIEAARASGASLRSVARRFALTGKDVVHYHFKHHVTPERRATLMVGPARLESLANQAADESRSLLERMSILTSVLFARVLACAEAGDDHALANLAGRLNFLFRDYARLTGELREASSVTINHNTLNIVTSPEFVALQSGLLAIARAHPGVRADIVALLRGLDAKAEAPAPLRPNGDGHGLMIEGQVNVA